MPTKNDTTNIAIMKQDISYIRDDIAEIKKALQENYVTKDQFMPVKRIAYGVVTVITGIFVTAFGYILSASERGK